MDPYIRNAPPMYCIHLFIHSVYDVCLRGKQSAEPTRVLLRHQNPERMCFESMLDKDIDAVSIN